MVKKANSSKNRKIVIMGGGPAGVLCACGLRDVGYDTLLITRPRPFPAWEGLSERSLNSLKYFGFSATVKAVGPMVERHSHWNGISQHQNREYILNRERFDQALLQDTRDKGVTIIEARIEKVQKSDNGWQIGYLTNNNHHTLSAAFLVEARGRESKLSHQSDQRKQNRNTTPATAALLKSYVIPKEYEAMTAVASFKRGWAWYVRDGMARAILQIFIDSERGALPSKPGLDKLFLELVAQIPEAKDWLKDAVPRRDEVSVRTAAPRKAALIGGRDFLVVGDGSLALDPLSGNGIFYAIGSGLAAIPVINTLLKKPADGEMALQFFQERIDTAFQGGCLMGREFYAEEKRWPREPFWRKRQNWPKESGPKEIQLSHPDPLSSKPEIREKPVVKEGFITLEQVIITANHPRGVWQIDGVPLVSLLKILQAGVKDVGQIARQMKLEKTAVNAARKWLDSYQML